MIQVDLLVEKWRERIAYDPNEDEEFMAHEIEFEEGVGYDVAWEVIERVKLDL